MASPPRTILALNKSYLTAELRALGHTVYTAAIPQSFSLSTYELTSERKFDLPFEPGISLAALLSRFPSYPKIDTLLYFDDSSPSLHLTGIADAGIATIFLSVDAHLHSLWHPMLAGMFDHVLVAQKDYLPLFMANAPRSTWFPLWAAREVSPLPTKSIDVCFRGALDKTLRPKRIAFLEELAKYVPVDSKWEDYTLGFPKARIAINETIQSDLNFRVFEALMCGALLVTPRTGNGLLEIFEERKHLVTYEEGNAKDASEKIRYYLEHEAERAKIAEAGRAEVMQRHTSAQRALTLHTLLKTAAPGLRPQAARARAAQGLIDAALALGRLPREIDQNLITCAELLPTVDTLENTFDDSLSAISTMCLALLAERGHAQASVDLVSRLFGKHPNEKNLLLTLLGLLEKQGKLDQASQVAAAFSNDPVTLMGEARSFCKEMEGTTAQLRAVLAML